MKGMKSGVNVPEMKIERAVQKDFGKQQTSWWACSKRTSSHAS